MKNNRRRGIAQCEIVSVGSARFLVNTRCCAYRYETRDGAALTPGYYLAVWPPGASLTTYGHDIGYLGPHATAVVVRVLLMSAIALGLLPATSVDAGACAEFGSAQGAFGSCG